MLWYKAWLETRSRFLIALVGAVALCSRLVVVFLNKGAPNQLSQVLHATHETLAAVWLLAVTLIMMGGLLRERAVGSSSFTLSLPVSSIALGVSPYRHGAHGGHPACDPSLDCHVVCRECGKPDAFHCAGQHSCFFAAGRWSIVSSRLLSHLLIRRRRVHSTYRELRCAHHARLLDER